MKVTSRSRKAWRSWLEKNHGSMGEVWLVFYKRSSGKPTLSYNDAVEEALCFGWVDGIKRSVDEERYMHRFTPRKPESRWSPTNRKRAQRMEKEGLMTDAGRKAIRAAKRRGKWTERRAEFDRSMPPELAAFLLHDKKAAAFFEGLAPSYRQAYLVWVNAAKRVETRKRRLDETKALLRRGEKLGMR